MVSLTCMHKLSSIIVRATISYIRHESEAYTHLYSIISIVNCVTQNVKNLRDKLAF